MPGLTGFEHVSITVPDLDEAVGFFVSVLGAAVIAQVGFSGGTAPMDTNYNAHPDAQAARATLDLGGTVLEVWEYAAPDLRADMPRNCDAGGHHLGLGVEDVAVAADHLRAVPGVRVLGSPTYGVRASGRTRGWVYFLTPWGLQMELADEH